MAIFIYRPRRKIILFKNDQQLYIFRSIRPSSGINIYVLETTEMLLKYGGICEMS